MSKVFLTTHQLAERWGMHPGALARWREQGKGPAYIKDGHWVRYSLEDIESYEQSIKQHPSENNDQRVSNDATASGTMAHEPGYA